MAACEAWSERLSAWIDGEATPEERIAVEDHLGRCERCAEARRLYLALGKGLRAFAAASAHRVAPRRKVVRQRWGRLAVAAMAAALVAGIWMSARVGASRDRVLEDAELRHRQAFARAEPCDLSSSDPAAVAGWLREHTGRAVVVPAAAGARLLGARTCRIAGDLTAHLLYRDGTRGVSLLAPAAGTRAARVAERLASAPDRCTVAPGGGRVCAVRTRTGPALAVGDVDPASLLAFTE